MSIQNNVFQYDISSHTCHCPLLEGLYSDPRHAIPLLDPPCLTGKKAHSTPSSAPNLHFPIQLWFQHDSFLLHFFSPTTPARQCIGYPELWLFPLPVALPVWGSYPKVISCWHSLVNFRLLITKAYFSFFPHCALNVCIPLIHSLKYSSQTHMVFGDEAFGKELRLGEASRWCPQMSLVAL